MSKTLTNIEANILKAMRDKFNSWYGFLNNSNSSNCNIEYLQGFYAQVECYPNNKRLSLLFDLAHLNLMRFCIELGKFDDLYKEVEVGYSELQKFALENMQMVHDRWLSDEKSFQEFTKRVMSELKIKYGSPLKAAMDSWRKSACDSLIKDSARHDLGSFGRLAELTDSHSEGPKSAVRTE